MITLEDAKEMGINAPWSHQRIISRLLAALSHRYYIERSIALEPLPEAMLDETQTSPVPDILLHDTARAETPVIIEITHTATVKKDLKKIRALIEADDYGIVEGFVYDYKTDAWHKYKKGVGDVLDKPSYCDALRLDLASLLYSEAR